MLLTDDFVRASLELNLFFLRIAREHSFLLKTAIPPKHQSLSETAGYYMRQFDALLERVVILADGKLGEEVLFSGQFVTELTLDAERMTQFYTGILINTAVTENELAIKPGAVPQGSQELALQMYDLNQKTLAVLTAVNAFTERLITLVNSCSLLPAAYPTMIDHILRENTLFASQLLKLQNDAEPYPNKEYSTQEAFWNHLLSEHAEAFRGQVDFSEVGLFHTNDTFGKTFEILASQALHAVNDPSQAQVVSDQSLSEAKKFRDFNITSVTGLLKCRIKSIIFPLAIEHDLREVNHYIYLLQQMKNNEP